MSTRDKSLYRCFYREKLHLRYLRETAAPSPQLLHLLTPPARVPSRARAPLLAEPEDEWDFTLRIKTAAWDEEKDLNFISSKYLPKHHLSLSLKDVSTCVSSLSPFIDFTRKSSTRAFTRKNESTCVDSGGLKQTCPEIWQSSSKPDRSVFTKFTKEMHFPLENRSRNCPSFWFRRFLIFGASLKPLCFTETLMF